jgi:hypothetical protein
MWIHESLRVTLCNAFSYIHLASPRSPLGGEWSLIRRLRARCRLPPSSHLRMILGTATTCSPHVLAVVDNAFTRVALGRPPDHPRPCDASVTALIGGRRGHAHPLPQGASSVHPPGCNHRRSPRVSPRVSGGSQISIFGCLAGTLGPVGVDATSRSPPRSGAIEVVFSGCVADILETVDASTTLPSLRISRGRQELLTGHLQDRLGSSSMITFGIAFGSSSRLPSRSPSGSPSGSPPDHPRHSLGITSARAPAVFTDYHRDVLGFIYAASFASTGRLGTGLRRRTAR